MATPVDLKSEPRGSVLGFSAQKGALDCCHPLPSQDRNLPWICRSIPFPYCLPPCPECFAGSCRIPLCAPARCPPGAEVQQQLALASVPTQHLLYCWHWSALQHVLQHSEPAVSLEPTGLATSITLVSKNCV